MRFSELETICGGKIIHLPHDHEIKGLFFDTRKMAIQNGAFFFAIAGENHDGHLFIEEAYRKGIRMFAIEKKVPIPADASAVLVDRSIGALQKVAAAHRANFSYPIIGITGSNGKTIVKEWLGQVLGFEYDIVKSPKSYNSQLGVPLSVWQMSSRHNLGIFEAGISERGEMEQLEKVIHPTIGIFTNLGEAHNSGFDSPQEKAKEKAKLFMGCQKVIYCENHRVVEEAIQRLPESVERIGWTATEDAKRTYNVKTTNATFKIQLRFDDPSSVENALTCAVLMNSLGYATGLIQERINQLSSIRMRLEMKRAINRSYVIDDTYNNDLYGLEIALDFLNRQTQKTQKTVILSDLFQTGFDRGTLFAKVGELVKKNGVKRVVGIGREIKQEMDQFPIGSKFYDTTEDFLKAQFSLNNEIVLVKGARDFGFERIVEKIEEQVHGTMLEINLENVVHNLNYYRSQLKPEVKMMVMVKAFAYGGGNFEIANLLQYHKVDYLGVAYADEAVNLRKNGIHLPIMIMNPAPESFRLLKEFNLEPEIYSHEQLYDYINYFEGEEIIPPIHLKLETGMNRLGFTSVEIKRLIQVLQVNKQLKVKSVFSHLAGSEDPRHQDFTKKQAELFKQMSDQILASLWYKPMLHLVNSGGITNYPDYHFDMVRLGIGLHGFEPTLSHQDLLLPVGTLKTVISQIKKIKAGESIGYGRHGMAKEDMKIAIVPIGYADGYARAFGNGVGKMMVGGQLVPTIGNICMDMTMLDVSRVQVQSGDDVIVFGEQPTIWEMADWINTIPYEILTNVSQRVKRVFVSG